MNTQVKKLIIVPGHASFREEVQLPLPTHFDKDVYWALQSFQKGEPPFYVEQIKEALAVSDAHSLVVFSGGRTRLESGAFWSEAQTYYEIAKKFSSEQHINMTLETYARDSFQNLDFSVRKFRQHTGADPEAICVIGWAFKKDRFDFHAKTLGIQPSVFTYVSVNNPLPEDLPGALVGEQKTLQQFKDDPFGEGKILYDKRSQRDPYSDGLPTDY
jgi:hypothetical protein